MNKLILVSSSALLLGLAVPAQETSSGAALTIRTTDQRMAAGMLRNFGDGQQLPELDEGGGIVLTLDDGGRMAAAAGEAKGWMHLSAHPPALMQIFAGQVQQGRGVAQMFAGAGLGKAGFDYEQINTMLDTAFRLPEQIERLDVYIAERPNDENGADVRISMVPVADTWLGNTVAALRPNPTGVVRLDGDGATVEGALSTDLSRVAPALRPMMQFFSGMGARNDEQREQAAEISAQSMQVLDGTMSFLWNLDSGLESIMGLRDPTAMLALWEREGYADVLKRTSEIAGNAVAEFQRNAASHRDAQIASLVVEYDTPEDMPFVEDGIMNAYYAVAGDKLVSSSMTDSQAAIKGLIDLVKDDQLEPRSLGQGVLMTVRVGVADMVEFMAEMQNQPLPPMDLPLEANLTVTKSGKGIDLRITIL